MAYQQPQAGGYGQYPQGYAQQGQQHQHQQNFERQSRTLWQGDLDPYMDEGYLTQLYNNGGEQVVVRIPRNGANRHPQGYAFVEFPTQEAAGRVLASWNGHPIQGTGRNFNLNWASGGANSGSAGGGGGAGGRVPESEAFALFVGDLSPQVTDFVLASTFQAHYQSVISAKIVVDKVTREPKGFGFVRFSSQEECERALTEMDGQYCLDRPMRCREATQRNNQSQSRPPQQPGQYGGGYATGANAGAYNNAQGTIVHESVSTTIFIGGLDPYVTADDLTRLFCTFGELTYVRIPPNKGIGFVSFVDRAAAEGALHTLQGYQLGQSELRLSWGRSQPRQGAGAYSPAVAAATPGGHVSSSYRAGDGIVGAVPAQGVTAVSHVSHVAAVPVSQPARPALDPQAVAHALPDLTNMTDNERYAHARSAIAGEQYYGRDSYGVHVAGCVAR